MSHFIMCIIELHDSIERKKREGRQVARKKTAQEMLRARTEALVAKMEKEEMELIARLQNTQTVQRSAYEELEVLSK